LDAAGNLYGVSSNAGQYGYGRVFELSPSVSGWTETVLYNFTGGEDGAGPSPTQSLVFDTAGNLYGTTVDGGTLNAGTVFKLTPKGGGNWAESVIHSFLGNPGGYPESGLVLDAAGNLYGTTFGGSGAVFEISPQSGGTWKYRVLHRFQNRGRGDGSGPVTALAFDANGNLYGTTYAGGTLHCGLGQNGCGTVFKLTPTSGGGWLYRQIYKFKGESDGERPSGKRVDHGMDIGWPEVVGARSGEMMASVRQSDTVFYKYYGQWYNEKEPSLAVPYRLRAGSKKKAGPGSSRCRGWARRRLRCELFNS